MAENPWDEKYLYYTNEDPCFNSVMKVDSSNMTLRANIPVWGLTPHSVDRACKTDKMYVRTQGSYSFAVIDARTEEFIKRVDLPFRPRTCGDQNYKYDLQLVGGTSDPGVALIDVKTDTVIFVDWEPKGGRKALGNQGGSAAGHAVWFDDKHFGYLNRLSREVKIFKIAKVDNHFHVYHIQTLRTPTSLHTIQDDIIDTKLTSKKLYGALEGFVGNEWIAPVTPGIVEYHWNPDSSSPLSQGRTTTLTHSGPKDTLHHYSITKDGKDLWIPTFFSKKTHVIRLSDMKITNTYDSGWGGGHVNFSERYNLAIVTNHLDNVVTIIRRSDGRRWNVRVSGRESRPLGGKILQTHSNWVIEDGKYFFLGCAQDGEFVKIDLRYKRVIGKLFVGGRPEQSIS